MEQIVLRNLSTSSHYLIRRVQQEMITSEAHFTKNNESVWFSVQMVQKLKKTAISPLFEVIVMVKLGFC